MRENRLLLHSLICSGVASSSARVGASTMAPQKASFIREFQLRREWRSCSNIAAVPASLWSNCSEWSMCKAAEVERASMFAPMKLKFQPISFSSSIMRTTRSGVYNREAFSMPSVMIVTQPTAKVSLSTLARRSVSVDPMASKRGVPPHG